MPLLKTTVLFVAVAGLSGPALHTHAATPKPQMTRPGGDWRTDTVHMYENYVNSRKVTIIQFPSTLSESHGAAPAEKKQQTTFISEYNAAAADPRLRMAVVRKYSDLGNAGVMYMAGWCYLKGNCGEPANPVLGMEWLRKSAEAGSAAAMSDYGYALANGTGMAQDLKKGVALIQRAADMGGGPGAYVTLGGIYFNSDELGPDHFKLAREAFLRAGDEPTGLGLLGLIYDYGLGVPVDEAKAAGYLQRAAAAGNVKALAYYGGKLASGTPSTPVNLPLARRYLLAASQGNEPVGDYNYAALAEKGQHVEGGQPDGKLAFFHYKRAADNDYTPAMYEVANSYMGGLRGQTVDREKGVALAKLAASAYTPAQDLLTAHYMNTNQDALALASSNEALKRPTNISYLHRGQAEEFGMMGFAEDTPTAASWYQKAAADGSDQAHWRLGFAYIEGKFGLKNAAEGRRHLQIAADAGVHQAQSFLGQVLLAGIGGPRDKPQAVVLFRKAAAQGNKFAAKYLAENGLAL